MSDQTVKATDGTDIFVKKYDAKNPKAQVILMHGYLEHCLRYEEFALYLTSRDISVTTFDFRGHGQSSGARGLIYDWNDYELDFAAARSTLSTDLPTFFYAHSNGGLFTMNHVLGRAADDESIKDIKGVVTTAPFLRSSSAVPFYKVWAARLLGNVLPTLPVPSGLTSKDLMHDPEKIKAHDEDKMVLEKGTLGWAKQAFGRQGRIQADVDTAKFELPIMIVYGENDPVASPKVIGDVGERLQAKDKTIIVRKDELHEVLNEIKREETYKLTVDWMLERL